MTVQETPSSDHKLRRHLLDQRPADRSPQNAHGQPARLDLLDHAHRRRFISAVNCQRKRRSLADQTVHCKNGRRRRTGNYGNPLVLQKRVIK